MDEKERDQQRVEEVVETATNPELPQEPTLKSEEATRPVTVKPEGKFKRLISRLTATKKRKVLFVLVVVLVVLGILLAVPFTRYAIFGRLVHRNATVRVLDALTGKPVSDVKVTLGEISALSDKNGDATLHSVAAGAYNMSLSKKYYSPITERYTVGLFTVPRKAEERMSATGRQVTFTVSDTIGGQKLADARLKIGEASAVTDKNGEATIVIAPKPDKQDGTISKDGYNPDAVTVNLNDSAQNNLHITQSGSVVFLNNGAGNIDVVRANLDGSDSKVIVAGTGKENKYSTALLSARDWKYSVLKSSRDGDKEKLYLVTTKDGTIGDVDEGNVSFTLIGWLGHTFYYTVDRSSSEQNDRRYALKSYDADAHKLTTLDETSGSGSTHYDSVYQTFSSIYILNNELVYAKYWNAGYYSNISGKNSTLYSLDAETTKKTVIKEFPQQNANLSLSLYEPQGVYVQYANGGDTQYYEYEDHTIKTVDAPQGDFYDYPTYLASPSDKKTFWYEIRNGKNTLFIGNDEGKNAKQVATLSEYTPYGWYGANDDYILFTKNGSELYIASANSDVSDEPLKITDYYKVQSYPGYGKGYGGQ